MKIEFQTTISKDKLGIFNSSLGTYYNGIQFDFHEFLGDNLTELDRSMIAYAQRQIEFFSMFDVSQMHKLKVK